MSSVFRHFLRKFLVSNYIKCIRPDKEFMNKAIEAQNTKTKLSEVQKNDELLGITDFWKGISMEDLEGITYDYATDKFYPSSKEFSKKAEKMNKKFEKMKDKVNDFNRKKGNKEVAKSVGGSSGTPGPWNNGFNKSIPKKGYVIIGDKDNEFQAYGEFEHAGIFNSDANHKKVVWSSPGYGCVSGYEWEIDWQTMYSDVYVMKVWVANDSQRVNAYNWAYVDSYNKPYDAWSPKWDGSKFSCAKIPWWGYYYGCGIDIDLDSVLPWTTPTRLYNSFSTWQVHHFH
ncbi:MAG: hypothetical protein BWY74_03334 [Firmicutes bacterium ADurb.Bin419]|nr:MAG: hypothetical protein BWY74_03334 [Firmicutes bacterium ADurb.Bin419]